jgi:hypothetical protein
MAGQDSNSLSRILIALLDSKQILTICSCMTRAAKDLRQRKNGRLRTSRKTEPRFAKRSARGFSSMFSTSEKASLSPHLIRLMSL